MAPSGRLRRFRWMLIGAWTLVVAASLGWNLLLLEQGSIDLARTTAVTLYQQDLLYRRWATDHGGVYAPVTPDTPANPHLQVFEREIATPSGRVLTLINPSYMNRQVYELANRAGQPQGHITSLKPIRPQNAPDPWEEKALQAFAQGQPEASSIEPLAGQPYLRLMRPFYVEQNCLPCHASQGYKEGDILGGISEAVPMAPMWLAARSMRVALGGGHGLLWLLGTGGILLGFRQVEKAQAQIISMTRTDSLTGLANRRYFLEILDRAKAFAVRHQQPLALIMADLDHFKTVNDRFGHDAGDRLLKAFAKLLAYSVRKEDLPVRFGGEEFMLLLPGTDGQKAAVLAERLRQSLESLEIPEIDGRMTASFGVTQFLGEDTAETFIKRVDEALYEGKEKGRNMVITKYS
ncbi:MAG: diguanylate cyclase [Desulfobaccales bacterium]